MSEGLSPSTRLSSTESRPGCTTLTRSPAAIEKLVQSRPAFGVDCRISIWPGVACLTVVWPKVGTAPCGRAKDPGAAPMRQAARLTGRSAVARRR